MLDLFPSPVTDAVRDHLARSLVADRYRHAHAPLYVISDSAYREVLDAQRREHLAALEADATHLRQRLAACEAQIQELTPVKPDT